MAKKKTALDIKTGVNQPDLTHKENIKHIKAKRKSLKAKDTLFEDIISGSLTALSKGITLLESTLVEDKKTAKLLINECLKVNQPASKIGITGIPGVGKSTFIEALGLCLLKNNHKLAVLTIDPSSPVNKGSILGDKTRMENLSKHPKAFIRPSATGTTLGGVARATRESIILCEAAGYDTIIIETVGIGQSEVAVKSMVDLFILLQISGTGDELQGIKRGVIEMADTIIINKSDGENIKASKQTKQILENALQLYPEKPSLWPCEILLCSAIEQSGLHEIWNHIESFMSHITKNGYLKSNRASQNMFWFEETYKQTLTDNFKSDPSIKKLISDLTEKIKEGSISPFEAAETLLASKFNF